MRVIDTHLHVDKMSIMDIQTLTIAGVEAAIVPTGHYLPLLTSADTLLMIWRNLSNFQVGVCKSLGLDIRVTLSVPFSGLSVEAAQACLKQLPKYLENENVVGIGEIGLDSGSEDELRLFRTQLNIAKEHNLPVIVHTATPFEPQAIPILDQVIKIIHEENFPIERVVLDHSGRNTLEARLDSGAMVGLGVCFDKLRPDDVAEIVLENPDKRDRFLINSELGYFGQGYFSVPRAVLSMRQLGLPREEIEKMTWDNPKRFFNLTVK